MQRAQFFFFGKRCGFLLGWSAFTCVIPNDHHPLDRPGGIKCHSVFSRSLAGDYLAAALGYSPTPTSKFEPTGRKPKKRVLAVIAATPEFPIGSVIAVKYPNQNSKTVYAAIVLDYNPTWGTVARGPYYIQYFKGNAFGYVKKGRITGNCLPTDRKVIGANLILANTVLVGGQVWEEERGEEDMVVHMVAKGEGGGGEREGVGVGVRVGEFAVVERKKSNCQACNGRHVRHTCQKTNEEIEEEIEEEIKKEACKDCGGEFVVGQGMANHMKTCPNNEDRVERTTKKKLKKKEACKDCGGKFVVGQGMANHRNVCPNNKDRVERKKQVKEKEKEKGGEDGIEISDFGVDDVSKGVGAGINSVPHELFTMFAPTK